MTDTMKAIGEARIAENRRKQDRRMHEVGTQIAKAHAYDALVNHCRIAEQEMLDSANRADDTVRRIHFKAQAKVYEMLNKSFGNFAG